jgi:hypothetical protein
VTLTPELLRSVAVARLRETHPDLAVDACTPNALRELAPRGDTVVVAVIGRFSLPDWVRETCRFALATPAERHGPWRRSFTRTVHLAGWPDNLRDRFAFDHVAADGSVAWVGPGPDAGTATLRRLLKTFHGGRELRTWAPVTVGIPGDAPPGGPVHRELYVATTNMTVARAVVQVNHLLVEAVMDGLIGPGDRLTLRAVPRLTGLTAPLAALRVDADSHRPQELQAYAALTEET